MTQLSLIPSKDISSVELQKALIKSLSHGGWRHREDLALQLGVSVRAIRDAAHSSKGQILSGQNGLRLTVCASKSEIEDALARLSSQISSMTIRIIEIREVWDALQEQSA